MLISVLTSATTTRKSTNWIEPIEDFQRLLYYVCWMNVTVICQNNIQCPQNIDVRQYFGKWQLLFLMCKLFSMIYKYWVQVLLQYKTHHKCKPQFNHLPSQICSSTKLFKRRASRNSNVKKIDKVTNFKCQMRRISNSHHIRYNMHKWFKTFLHCLTSVALLTL